MLFNLKGTPTWYPIVRFVPSQKGTKISKSPKFSTGTAKTPIHFPVLSRIHGLPRKRAGKRIFTCANPDSCSPGSEAGQAQIPDIGNRQYQTTSNNRLTGRKPSCAICERIYNNMRETLAITPYTAAGAALPGGCHARNCGPSQPDQPIQEPRLSPISQAAIRSSVLNANNRPVQTVVQPRTQPHKPFMLVRYR